MDRNLFISLVIKPWKKFSEYRSKSIFDYLLTKEEITSIAFDKGLKSVNLIEDDCYLKLPIENLMLWFENREDLFIYIGYSLFEVLEIR